MSPSTFGWFVPAATGAGESGALITKQEWQTLDAYFNVDEGGGKIGGIYTQGNYSVGNIFRNGLLR